MVRKKEYPVTQSNNYAVFGAPILTKYQLELQWTENIVQ